MKDNFSNQADQYAIYRPVYPQALYNQLLPMVPLKKEAWDCGTGNGQTAAVLSRHFEKVYATDISEKQMQHGIRADNIIYKKEPAEQSTLQNNSINLITVSQALHWFRLDEFYLEVKRVAAANALIAVWTYNLLRISEPVDQLINEFHYNKLGPYWDEERKYVDNAYARIPFPFSHIQSFDFEIALNWSVDTLKGYLKTWSALQQYKTVNEDDPVEELAGKLTAVWGPALEKRIVFPVHMITGRVTV